MAYTKQTWQDLPSKTTPINASRLGHIEQGIYDAASTADTAASNASSAISGLADKVDKVEGKGLSTNDFTDALKTKLDNIETGAEVNVQSDWNQSDNSADDYIKNKPTLGTSAYKNSTSVVTDSSDLVESGAVFDAIQDELKNTDAVVESTVGWVGKNLLNSVAVSKTTGDGFAFTVNVDKSVTMNGTASANRSLLLAENLDTTALAGCLVNGCGNREGVSFRITSVDYSTVYQEITTDDTPIENHGSGLSMYIRVANGTSCSNVVVEPMIRYADIIDATYEPYHASVSDSLEDKVGNSVIGTVEDGATASQAYAVNDVFIRNGALCKVTSAISQGDTLSNQFTVTNVGAILTALLNA